MKVDALWLGSFAGWMTAACALLFSYAVLLPRSPDWYWENPARGTQLLHDRWAGKKMLEHVAETDGILILGTSEASPIISGAPNFPELLRRDYPVVNFGAPQRTTYTHVDWLCHARPEQIPNRVYYVINPIYYQNWLNDPTSLQYLKHYFTREQAEGAVECLEKLPLHYASEKDRAAAIAAIKSVPVDDGGLLLSDRARAAAKILMKIFIRNVAWLTGATYQRPTRPPEWWLAVDPRYNVADLFLDRPHELALATVGTAPDSYRFVEFRILMDLLEQKGKTFTFVMGPYNKRFFSAVRPQEIEKFELAIDYARNLLCRRHHCLDLTGASGEPGLFVDFAHFTDAGAQFVASAMAAQFERAGEPHR